MARAQRAAASIPPPPLNRLVAGVALGVAVALSIALVVLALPRTAGREELPVSARPPSSIRSATTSPSALGITSLDRLGRTYLFPVAVLPAGLFSPESRSLITDPGSGSVFVSSSPGLDGDRPVSLPTPAGSLIPLEIVHRDTRTGLTLLRSSVRVSPPRKNVEVAPEPLTAAGTTMVLHGRYEHRVRIGLRIASTPPESFLPFEVDDVLKKFADAAPVTDLDGHFVGLFVHRDGAVGVVPVSAIVSFVERALQSPR
jgi:hypothetical protein